jgi:hypothetical protein
VPKFVRAGFIFEPTPTYPDQCKCFSCEKLFANWKHSDDPSYVHKVVSPQCSFMNSLTSQVNPKKVAKSPSGHSSDPDATTPVSGTMLSAAATPAATKTSRAKSDPDLKSAQRPAKVRKLSTLSSAPAPSFPSSPLDVLSTHPDYFMAGTLSMLPFLMQMQQYSAFLQSQMAQVQSMQQPMYPPLFDPMKPLLCDPAHALASLHAANLGALLPPHQELQPVPGAFAGFPGLGEMPYQLAAAQAQHK